MNVPHRLVLVEWRDANGGWRHGWRDLAEIIAEPVMGHGVSVGWLLVDAPDRIVVCPHLVSDAGRPPDQGDGEIIIPRDWVQSITDLLPSKVPI